MSKTRMMGAFAPIQRPRPDRRWQQISTHAPDGATDNQRLVDRIDRKPSTGTHSRWRHSPNLFTGMCCIGCP